MGGGKAGEAGAENILQPYSGFTRNIFGQIKVQGANDKVGYGLSGDRR
jgi:hypothetical protein